MHVDKENQRKEIISMQSLQKKLDYCGNIFAMGSKTASICRILRNFLELPLYIGFIASLLGLPL